MRWQKLKYDTITRLGEHEQQCEMEVIYSFWNVEQISDYLFIDKYMTKYDKFKHNQK